MGVRGRVGFVAAARRLALWLPIVAAFVLLPYVPSRLRALDFGAFYCAASTLAHGADPYRLEPLGSCERSVAVNGPIAAGAVIPAPLPPFALDLLRPLASIPFDRAQRCFDLLSILAFAATIAALRKLSNQGTIIVAYALAPMSWVVVALGQTVLLVLASIVTTALLLQQRRPRLAGLCCLPALIDPHLALPVWLSVSLWYREARLTLIAGTIALVGSSLIANPAAISIEYVAHVLPLHAASEAAGATQLSLTALLTFFGVPVHTAIVVGGLQYIAAVAAALVAASRFDAPAARTLVPVLGALLGGTFLHNYDLVLAIPAALLLLPRAPIVAVACIVLLAPHGFEAGGVIAPILSLVSAGVLLTSFVSLRAGIAAASLGAAILTLHRYPVTTIPATSTVVDKHESADFAESSWSSWEARELRTPAWILVSLPYPTGILVLFALSSVRSSLRFRWATPNSFNDPRLA